MAVLVPQLLRLLPDVRRLGHSRQSTAGDRPKLAGMFTANDSSPWVYLWNLPDEGVVMVTAVAYNVVDNARTPSAYSIALQ